MIVRRNRQGVDVMTSVIEPKPSIADSTATMNTGWRAISNKGRPVFRRCARVRRGILTNCKIATATRQREANDGITSGKNHWLKQIAGEFREFWASDGTNHATRQYKGDCTTSILLPGGFSCCKSVILCESTVNAEQCAAGRK